MTRGHAQQDVAAPAHAPRCRTELLSTRLFPKGLGAAASRPTGIAARCDWVVLSDAQPPRVRLLERRPGPPRHVFLSLRAPHEALRFFGDEVLGRLEGPFVLVSGSEDATVPQQTDRRWRPFDAAERAVIDRVLAHPGLIRWYAENLDRREHPRLSPLPLGMVHPDGPPVPEPLPRAPALTGRALRVLCAHRTRPGPQWDLRRRVSRLARGPWAGVTTRPGEDLGAAAFHRALAEHAFVLCAEGGGVDPAPKAWMALLHGAVPIIRRNALAPAYGLLPVVMVPRWAPDTLTPDRLRGWRDALLPWFDDPAGRAQVLERLGLEFWWRLIASGRPPPQAGAWLALDAGEGAAQAAPGPPGGAPAEAATGGAGRAAPGPQGSGLAAPGLQGGGLAAPGAAGGSGRPGPAGGAPTDPLARPAGRAQVAQALVQGLAQLEDIFGFAFPAPDRARLAACTAAPACAGADRFHAAALSALFPDFRLDRDGFDGLAARLSAHVPASPVVAEAVAGAAARFGAPDAQLLDEAARRLQVTAPDMGSLAAPGGHFHAKVNHGAWEDFTHLGLAGPPADPRLAAFRGTRAPYFEAVLPHLRACVDCRFLELFEAAFRRFAVAPGDGAALDGPLCSLGVSVVNGDTPHAEATRPPLGLVARGALPGLLAWTQAVRPQAGRLRLVDGGGMRQLVWQGRLEGFVAAATEGAEAVVFVVPDSLRRLALRDAAVPQYRLLVPGRHAHEFWPVVMASVLGQAAALMRRHRRLTVFLQAAVMSLPLVAGLQALAGRFPGVEMRCFDMGQVLDIADPARLGSRQLTARDDLAAVVAAQRVPFCLAPV